jgi:hypothetical protein
MYCAASERLHRPWPGITLVLVLGPKRAPEYTLRGLLGYYRQPSFLAFAVSLPSVRAPYTILICG